MKIDSIRQLHTVHVEDGSGVIVKTYSNDYWYLLTDYHVVKNIPNNNIKCCFSSKSPLKDKRIVILDDLRDGELDVAIFKISTQGLEELGYLPISVKNDEPLYPYRHIGFPKQRQNGEAISDSLVLNINSIGGSVNDNLMEYSYSEPPKKEEIEGMSGGAIYDGLYRLVGLHKQSSCIDEYELLGKATYIPIDVFKRVLRGADGWNPIQQFNLKSFEEFTDKVFAFSDDACIRYNAYPILMKLNEYEKQIEQLSPSDVVNTLKANRYLKEDMIIEEQCMDFWVSFSEFIIGIMVLLDFDVKMDDLILAIYEKFHFVYSPQKFDVYETREKLDISLLTGIRRGARLIVGGLEPSGSFKGCVLKPSTIVPTITDAIQYDARDISRNGRIILSQIIIANNSVFRKAIAKSVDDENNSFEYFKKLLKSKLQ